MAKLFEFVIGSGNEATSFDVTPFIVLNTYNVSGQSVFEEWTDGYGHDRRGVKRKRLEGSFSLKFFNTKDYTDFLTNIELAKFTGYDYYKVNAYDDKLRAVIQNVFVYLDYELPNLEPSLGYSFNEEIEITVTEM